MLDQIHRHQLKPGRPLTPLLILQVIAEHGYRELDFMRDSPDQRPIRDSIARAIWMDLTVSRGYSAVDVWHALTLLRDWNGDQIWQHSWEVANEPRFRIGRDKLAHWLAAWPFHLRKSLDDHRPPRDDRDLARVIPSIVPGKMPTDRVTVKKGAIELIELLHLSHNSEIWLCAVPDVPGRLVIKFGLTRNSRAFLKQEIAILQRLAPLGLEGVLMPLWNLSILKGPVRALTFRYIGDGSLAALLERNGGRLALKEVNQIVMPQLLRIFAKLHRLDPPVVHADIKPHNVLADRDADGRLCLLVNDCGASALQPKAPPEGEPEPGPMVRAATPSYASLEQLAGWQPSLTDDVYALCVLWCRLLGVDPIDDSRLPSDYLPIYWKERQRPGFQERLQLAGLTAKQIEIIVDGLGPNFNRPSCEEMLHVLGEV